MKEYELKDIQKNSLDVLLKIHEICEKNNLTYYLAYGTLLGAIRHQGFIPWDDDVDVWMPRKDFDKFRTICNEKKDELLPYKLCSRSNTKNYAFYIPRFSNMNFRYVTTGKNVNNFDIGIFVDIYPLDNYPNQEKKDLLFKKIDKINNNYYIYINGRSSTSIFKTFFKMCIHMFLKFRYGKNYPNFVDKEIEELIKENTDDSSQCIAMYAWETMTDCKFEFKKEWFQEKILMNFENYKFWVPKEYDEILKYYYGNYMELPPENERVPYHNYKIYKREDK